MQTEEDTAKSDQVGKQDDSEEQGNTDNKNTSDQSSEAESSKQHETAKETPDISSEEKTEPDNEKSGSDVSVHEQQPVVLIEEVVDSAETMIIGKQQTSRTAIVVLAMGLSITALLLIFVGCRLRNVKRRLRRGRPLNSNEADYLINGMYL